MDQAADTSHIIYDAALCAQLKTCLTSGLGCADMTTTHDGSITCGSARRRQTATCMCAAACRSTSEAIGPVSPIAL